MFSCTTTQLAVSGRRPFTPEFTQSTDMYGAISRQAINAFGSIHLSEIKREEYTIHLSRYSFNQETTVLQYPNDPSFAVVFALKGEWHYRLGSLHGTMLMNQCNMVYLPALTSHAICKEKEEYNFFTVTFSEDYFNRLQPSATPGNFLTGIEYDVLPSLILPIHAAATPEMLTIIQHVLHCEFDGTIKKIYLNSKILELTLLLLHNHNVDPPSASTDITLWEYDIEKIRQAREYLLQRSENPPSLQQLAHHVGINDFKLKHGFKKLYGTTAFNLIQEERLQKARNLLYETDMSVKEIASASGYKRLSSFTVAFKRRFGYLPSDIKRKYAL